jgi:hypothetical protein
MTPCSFVRVAKWFAHSRLAGEVAMAVGVQLRLGEGT